MRYVQYGLALIVTTALFSNPVLSREPGGAATAPAAQNANLRGYGKVSAEFAPGQATFQCADAEHADILLGKMLADLFWDAGKDHVERNLDVDGVEVTVHAWAPYGVLCAGRVGSQVTALGAENDAALLALLKRHPEFIKGSPAFAPAKPYPRYLDHYDLRAYKAYTGAMASLRSLGLDSHWPFLKKLGLSGIGFQSLGVTSQNPAPNVISFVSADYEMRMAQQEGGVASIGLGCGGEVPLWIYNRMPEAMMQPSPTTLLGAWNGPGPVGAHFESWWLPAQRRQLGSLQFMRQAMLRYRDNPALSAWHLYTGAPGAELSFHDRSGEFWDYSPTGQAAFRSWLRDACKFDLKQLGQRWYGDANHFATWEQVEMPDVNSFFGMLDDTCLRLADGWQWASARDGVQSPPPAGDAAWIPVEMPPSQHQVLLPWGEAFYRVEFDAGDWTKKPKVWLSCNTLLRADHPTIAWLNGQKVAEFVSNNNPLPFSIALAGKLKPGRNELILRIPRQTKEEPNAQVVREGKIFGPVYLTTTEPKLYPYLGEHANARYYDLRQWQAAGVEASHRVMLDLALAIDPDHPLNLSGGGNLVNEMASLAENYGASCQNTGREASYFPWESGVALVGGYYGTSEESTTANTAQLTRELGWLLLDGDSNHNLYYNIEDYQLEEQKTGWFTKNQRAIQCFGKYLRTMPQIAVFWSGRNMRLSQTQTWQWDLGLGELQSIHFDSAYATETELFNGKADVCPVLIDSGNQIMDDDVIQALHGYIQRGGTFIALEQSGMHTALKADAQPLARLTALRATPHAEGKLRIAKTASYFGPLAGREFHSRGVGLEPAAGVALAGDVPIALARWDDGSIAIASRRIGKGRIIQLGSQFWRDRGDTEKEFLSRLLTNLGVKRNADASERAIWARRGTTKNGLQDWLLTYNNDDVPHTADVRLAASEKPAEVWDLLSGKPVQAGFADGWITISNVQYEPRAVHLFVVKRADLVQGLPFWWGEKLRYWGRPPASVSPGVAQAKAWVAQIDNQVTADSQTIPFGTWHFLADRQGTVDNAQQWLKAGFNDGNWKKLNTGPWNLQDATLADWHGVGLYRETFSVPQSWKGRRVILNLYDVDRPIIYDQGEVFVNATKVAEYKAHSWSQAYAYDVTPLLHPGKNVLAVRVQGGKEFSGIGGSVWLEPERKFAKEIDLSGTWSVVNSDYKTTQPAQIPGAPAGRYLKRGFDLPGDWSGKTVYLHLETPGQWVSLVVVNGKLIGTNGAMHPFSPRAQVNITPYLVSGANRIELWPYATIPTLFAQETKPQSPMPLNVVRLGVVAD